jgi:hypothetical protein
MMCIGRTPHLISSFATSSRFFAPYTPIGSIVLPYSNAARGLLWHDDHTGENQQSSHGMVAALDWMSPGVCDPEVSRIGTYSRLTTAFPRIQMKCEPPVSSSHAQR